MYKIFYLAVLVLLISCGQKSVQTNHIKTDSQIDVTVESVRPVVKTYVYTSEKQLVESPRYCKWYGGLTGGLLTSISCMGYELFEILPNKTVEETATGEIFEITLSNGTTVYSRVNCFVGSRFDDYYQVELE